MYGHPLLGELAQEFASGEFLCGLFAITGRGDGTNSYYIEETANLISVR